MLDDPNIEIVKSQAEDLPFDSESFDAVVSTEVIEHLVRPRELVEQIARVLKPGGAFMVTAPSLYFQFLTTNPMSYLQSLVGVLDDRLLPPFHNLYEPLTDLPLIHYSFSVQSFRKLFREFLPGTRVTTMRYPHLRKFGLEKFADHIPWLRCFGGLVIAYGRKGGRP